MSTGSVTPFQPAISSGDKFEPSKRVTDIRQLYQASKKYIDDNYLEEFIEAWRSVKVRTNPIMVKDEKGNLVEDTNRTNVCGPDLNTIVKRKTARKTANPPTLNYFLDGEDPDMLGERLSARALFEYDRSGEAVEFKRLVNQADIFGFSYSKTFWDSVDIQRQVRYFRERLTNRRQLMKVQGAEPEQIEEAVSSMGEDVGSEEIANAIATSGPEIRSQVPTTIYEGPVTKCRFIGDIFLEPGTLCMNSSSYVIELYTETDLWLRKMAKKTYDDPENQGVKVPVFTPDKVEELLLKESKGQQDRIDDLRKELRLSIQKSDPQIENRILPGKRFEIREYHGPDKDGRLWIEYIGNDSVYLGRQPYPFDLCGRWTYTEYVPWPDLIGFVGDSAPRILRFLHAMYNANSGQVIDLVNQILCRTYKVESIADIPDQAVKKEFGNFLVLKGDMNAVQPFVEPEVPASAWQTGAFLQSAMRSNEPALGGVEAVGTNFNPQEGKTATTAILAAKSSDALMQAEIDQLNLYLKENGEKKLEIHRQISEKITCPNRAQYVNEALTQRFGKTSLITIEPHEINTDPTTGEPREITVEPLAGSTLAVDDEFRLSKLQLAYQMAEQDPVTWNKYEVAKSLSTTFKGIGDTSRWLNDPANAQPAGPKVSLSVNLPLDKVASIPADLLDQVLTLVGMQPSEDVKAMQTVQGIEHTARAANAAADLMSPAHPPKEDALQKTTSEVGKRVNGAPGA